MLSKQYNIQKIDSQTWPDHIRLEESDQCFYIGDYAAHEGFEQDEFNSFIHNLHKPMTKKNEPEWIYKQKAIEQAAELILNATTCKKIDQLIWVSMPSSKTKTHEHYDDRLLQILHLIRKKCSKIEIKELLVGNQNLLSTTHDGTRYSIQDLCNAMSVDMNLVKLCGMNPKIVIFDDIISSGAHFKAAQKKLTTAFENKCQIIGFFLGRSYYVK